tara:strand:+ start:622 stop:1086 length:465 start_codon:yes stop_codon:yes gene_type:complete
MQVKDALKMEVIKVKRSLTLRGMLKLYKDFHSHPVIPVVDKEDKLIGVVYPENLLDIIRPPQAKLFRNIPFTEVDESAFDLEVIPSMGELIIVDDIMNKSFLSLKEDISLNDAYKFMHLHNKDRLPVVDSQGKLVGILGIFDIVWNMFKIKKIV